MPDSATVDRDDLGVDTSVNLLERVKAHDVASWQRLVHLYSPLVYRWARKAGLQAHDAEDVVQDVFLAVASHIGKFRRDQAGDSFRGWLWTICRSKVLDLLRAREHEAQADGGTTARQRLEEVAIPEAGSEEASDSRCRLRQRALALLRAEFETHIWQAFVRTVVLGDHPVHVAKDLGISLATVYRARIRVRARLCTEIEGL